MFGHQPDPIQSTDTTNNQSAFVSNESSASDGFNPALPPDPANFGAQPAAAPSAPPVTDPNNLLEPQATDGFTDASVPDSAPESPQASDSAQPTVGTPSPLSDLKQQALQQLSPLVGHLEQTPEEKFRTTMMMIQASDNKDLLQTAYDAANQISDEKARAQALLDVINEINYFSQQS